MPERQYLSGSPATNRWNAHVDAMKYYYRGLARRKQDNKKSFDEMLDMMKTHMVWTLLGLQAMMIPK